MIGKGWNNMDIILLLVVTFIFYAIGGWMGVVLGYLCAGIFIAFVAMGEPTPREQAERKAKEWWEMSVEDKQKEVDKYNQTLYNSGKKDNNAINITISKEE